MRSFLRRKTSSKAPNKTSSNGDSRSPEDEEDEFHDSEEAHLHPEAHEEGGFAFTNKELLDKQRGAIVEMIKELGKKLLSGQLNLINISLPVKMFEPRSYLEKLTDVWVYPKYLHMAAEATDPVERLQHVMTWFVAGLQHVFQSWRKPFNPVLGETWQACLSDGSQVFLEQISHHPPISAFQLDGPNGMYQFSGMSQPEVSFELKANSIKTLAKGERRIIFRNGEEIEIDYPSYCMRGVLYTTMPRGDTAGSATFLDRNNKLMGEVAFGKIAGQEDRPLLQRPDSISLKVSRVSFAQMSQPSSPTLKRSSFSGFTSILSRGKEKDSRAPLQEQVLSTGCGNWLSHLDWNGQRCWTLTEQKPLAWQHVAQPLPSDSSFRKDLQALATGNLKDAQAAKEALEKRQREDAKLRKPALEGLSSVRRSTSLK